MDVLIKYGFTIEEIKIIMDSNINFDSINDKDVNELINILDDIGCLNKHIKNIFISNPFIFNQSINEIKKIIEFFYKIGLDNLWYLFDIDPFLLNNKYNFYKRIYDRLRKENKSDEEIVNYFYYELKEVI